MWRWGGVGGRCYSKSGGILSGCCWQLLVAATRWTINWRNTGGGCYNSCFNTAPLCLVICVDSFSFTCVCLHPCFNIHKINKQTFFYKIGLEGLFYCKEGEKSFHRLSSFHVAAGWLFVCVCSSVF